MSRMLRLDFVGGSRFRRDMSEDNERNREIARRLFYLITVATEDAATLAVDGQSQNLDVHQQADLAVRLRAYAYQLAGWMDLHANMDF